MITKLYIDNYKGFDKALIPIADVNFLVGENSTGKSTVMDLLYLIDHNPMPFVFRFNQESRLGNFLLTTNLISPLLVKRKLIIILVFLSGNFKIMMEQRLLLNIKPYQMTRQLFCVLIRMMK